MLSFKAKSECLFYISKRIMKALFAPLQTNGDWQLSVYDLTTLTAFDAEGFSVIDYEASLVRAQEGCSICHTIADHLLGSHWGSQDPGRLKIPILNKLDKSLSRNLLFAADAQKGPEMLEFFSLWSCLQVFGSNTEMKDYGMCIAGHFWQ